MAHENPLDRIYDSGSYRMVLTAEPASSTTSTLTWGAIFYTDAKGKTTELGSSDIQLASASTVLFSSASPAQTEINTVKQGTTLGAPYASIYTLTAPAAGSYTATTPQHKGSYIIQVNYKHDGRTGILFSNFAVIP